MAVDFLGERLHPGDRVVWFHGTKEVSVNECVVISTTTSQAKVRIVRSTRHLDGVHPAKAERLVKVPHHPAKNE